MKSKSVASNHFYVDIIYQYKVEFFLASFLTYDRVIFFGNSMYAINKRERRMFACMPVQLLPAVGPGWPTGSAPSVEATTHLDEETAD